MKKQMLTALSLTAGLGLAAATPASATTFDFAAMGADNESSYNELELEKNGLNLHIQGTNYPGPEDEQVNPYFVYLDGPLEGRPGGLGVCKELTGDECIGESDDSLGNEEILTLTFDEEVTIDALSFRNRLHYSEFTEDATFRLSVDGGLYNTHQLTPSFDQNLTGTQFSFHVTGAEKDNFLYLSELQTAEVPEPSTMALLSGGLVLTGWAARRRSKAKV